MFAGACPFSNLCNVPLRAGKQLTPPAKMIGPETSLRIQTIIFLSYPRPFKAIWICPPSLKLFNDTSVTP